MNERIRAIINEVHDVTGIRLEITDPEPAILLAQHRLFEILQQQNHAAHETRRAFEEEFKEKTSSLLQAVEDLQTYRKELLLELLNQNKQALDDTEGRLYAAISAKVAREQQAQLADWWDGRERWLLAATAVCATASLASLLVLLVMLFQ